MLALYRKYRPKTLSEVIGEYQVIKPLSEALKSGKVSHSYLFTGPRGCGKTSVARILAHEVNGFKYELEDSYLDIIEIDAASNTGVDNIRDLREKAMIAPSEGKFKVYIIDEVHMLSKSAFNALLKTLEEPPEHVIFILATTDLEKVPVTITSRSQVFHFRLADPTVMENHLKEISKKEGIKISDGALKIIVSRGGGSFRDSLSLLDQISTLGDGKTEISEELVSSVLGLPLSTQIDALLSAHETSDEKAVSSLLKDLISEGLKPEKIAESLIERILENPTRESLPLLEKLPSVSAPFPEAKLLLALLSSSVDAVSLGRQPVSGHAPRLASQGQAALAKSSCSGNGSVSPQTANEKQIFSRRGESHSLSESFPPARAATYIPDGTEKVAKQSFPDSQRMTSRTESGDSEGSARPQALEKIDLSTISPAIAQQLQKCKLREESGVVHIYPSKKIVKTILDRPGNREILSGFFNKEFIIHDPGDLEKSPEIAQISDIMGNIEEVNTDGGVPF